MALKPRSAVFEASYVGAESLLTPGTPVAAARKLGALTFSLTPDATTDIYRPSGSKFATAGQLLRELTQVSGEGRPDFREIVYYLSSALTDPVISTPVGATTARQWAWTLNTAAPDNQRTLTLESGTDAVRAAHVSNVLLTDFTLTTDKQNAPSLSVAGFGKAMSDDHVRWLELANATGGTFTISLQFEGGSSATTAAINYNDTASDIQSAIAALVNVGAGNVIVTGGPADSSPVRIELVGARRDTQIASWSVDGSSLIGAGAEARLTRLTPGSSALDLELVTPVKADIFTSAVSFADLDAVEAAPGNSGAETDVFNYNWTITGRNEAYYPLNSNHGTTFAGTVENAPNATVSFAVASGNRSGFYLGALRSQTRLYQRLRLLGNFIETVGGNDLYQKLTIDTCFNISGISDLTSIAGNVLGHTFTGTWSVDPTTNRTTRVTLITDVTGL